MPPLAVMLWLYALAAVAAGSVDGDRTIVGALTVRVYAWLPVALVLSVAVIVKLKLPPAVGVPDSVPVELLSVKPAGNAPALIE